MEEISTVFTSIMEVQTEVIQQVVPTKQSDWLRRNLERAQISMTARLTHHLKYYSAEIPRPLNINVSSELTHLGQENAFCC